MQQRLSTWTLLLGMCLLSACSSYAPPDALTGMTIDAVVARMGKPDMERRTDSGSRLEFPRGPYGRQTWFVYFDVGGRASRAEQVLTEQNFQRVTPGMAQDAVSELLGRPGETYLLARNRGVVWNYRYENQICRWFQIELTPEKQVRSAGLGPLPECDPRRDD